MKLTFSLRSGDREVDLVATTDATAVVGDLATHLALADPARASGSAGASSAYRHTPKQPGDGPQRPTLTLALVDQGMRALDARDTIAESGLRSGVRVAVVPAGQSFVDRGAATATAVVVAGPDAGREFPLARGSAYIGRERGCDVLLTDQSVSRRHARLVVAETVEIVDLGSANGVTVGGEQVSRVVVKPGDVLQIGDTELEIRVHDHAGAVVGGEAGAVAFSRSPRIAPVYPGVTHQVPELPEKGKAQPFPWIMMAVPLLMAVVMFQISGGNWFSVIFMAMMPLMIVGTWWDSRRASERDYRTAMAEFREDLATLVDRIRGDLATEGEVRRGELPTVQDCLAAIRQRGPLLWTRRRGDPGFLEVRLGLGTMPSRSTIKLPAVGRAKAKAWLEVSDQLAGLQVVPDVPVPGEPLQHGAIGVCGPRPSALATARALVLQLAALHSPADVVICGFAAAASARDWDFLKWLPHAMSPYSPLAVRHLATTAPMCNALADALEEVLVAADAPSAYPRPSIVVLVEPDAPIARSRLVQLAERGAPHGIVVVWIAASQAQLPAACRTFLSLGDIVVAADSPGTLVDRGAVGGPGAGMPGAESAGAVGYVHLAEVVTPVLIETVTAAEALAAARRLAPVVDSGVPIDDASDLPRSVSLAALAGADLLSSADAVLDRWSESRSILTGPRAPDVLPHKAASLRAVVGQSAVGVYSIDIRTDGPHALVGGTTGAGKSELLQAWILGMALAHSPQRVTFLLVDYKGGSAFRDCVRLPHTVGLVTDLSPHLVRRALASLSAELRYREHLLARHKAKDLVELERRGEVDAPPSLIIVVDEFAALVQEVPEFVDGVVNVAQRGRSLGLHLILATQRPAGVIKDNLRANTNLRIALRMADESDSDDVLGSRDAAYFDPALPGRAMSKTGPGRLVPFQAGYAGGWTSEVAPPADVLVETLVFGPSVTWEVPDDSRGATEQADPGPTDIQRLVASIGTAHGVAQLPIPRKPWLPDLGQLYDLAQLPTRRSDDELVFGVADDPDNQDQPVVSFRPDKEGNLAIYGASGSGKSALLRTLALAAGFTVEGGPCQVYGLDFGNRGLAMLDDLPHVGSIVAGNDPERVSRLLSFLRETIDERAVRYSRASASTISEYRRLAGRPDEARILVLIDNMTAFRQAYEVGSRYRTLDLLASLAADGRPVGVHFVVAADQRAGMPSNLAAAFSRRVVLRMATVEDYLVFGLPMDVLTLNSPAGRGLFGDVEVQCAVLGGSADVTLQSRAVTAFGEALVRAGVAPAPPIRSLVESVALDDLPVDVGGMPVLGVASSSLAPIGFMPRGSFVVIGPSGSGRTTAMATMATALRRWSGAGELFLLTPRAGGFLGRLGVFTEVAAGPDQCDELAGRLLDRLATGASAPMAVFVERADDVLATATESLIAALAKALVDAEQFVVAEGDTTLFASNYGFAAVLKTSRTGLALHPEGNEGTIVFKADLPGLNRAETPPGRGFLVVQGKIELIQTART